MTMTVTWNINGDGDISGMAYVSTGIYKKGVVF